MPQAVIRKLLQFVRGPVPEIEWPGRSSLEGVASPDMLQVQLRASVYQLLDRRGIAFHHEHSICLNPSEEFLVFDQCYLDCFRRAATPVTVQKRVQQFEIVDHGKWRCKRTQKILLAKPVHARLYSEPGIVLRKDRTRKSNESNASMRRSCSVAGHIKCCAPTDCDHERMAADSMDMDCTPHRIYVAAIVLHGFAAGRHDRRRNALRSEERRVGKE